MGYACACPVKFVPELYFKYYMLLNRYVRVTILIILLVSTITTAVRATTGPAPGTVAADTAAAVPGEPAAYKSNKFILPFVSYTPETSLMAGGVVVYQFKPGRAARADIETRSSQIITSAIYTLNRQFLVEFHPNILTQNERWILDGSHYYAFFPDRYWGVGPYSRSADEMDVEYRLLQFEQAFLRKVAPNLHVGPLVRWSRLSQLKLTGPDGDPVPAERIVTEEESTLPGVGFSVRRDMRNSITWPTENYYVDVSTLYYPAMLGATHPHASWLMDARAYFDMRGDGSSVLAFQIRTRMTEGRLPFQEFSMLGGQEILRGYHQGRFRDANAVQVQAELRQHVYWRFGITVFAATGEVWNRFEDFSMDNAKFAAGAGLRFDVNPGDTSNMRIDYGIGRHGSGLYITIGEAF